MEAPGTNCKLLLAILRADGVPSSSSSGEGYHSRIRRGPHILYEAPNLLKKSGVMLLHAAPDSIFTIEVVSKQDGVVFGQVDLSPLGHLGNMSVDWVREIDVTLSGGTASLSLRLTYFVLNFRLV